jgi:hypothetical protein
MEAIATYLVTMLTLVEVGLGIMVAGVLAIGLYETAVWMWSRVEHRGESPATARLLRTSR